jgi:hypothetical protein
MSDYQSFTQVYYCKQTESPGTSNRIAPAPIITISPEIYYANDSVVGYTYNVTLKGYANALRRELNTGQPIVVGLDKTVDHMGDIRDIFSFNGGNLHIKQSSTTLILAKGATIKSIQFDPSDNKWTNYAPFTVEIEFNEIDFTGCEGNSAIACNSSMFHTDGSVVSDNLIDMKNYKIKEFSDKWSITIDNQIHDSYSTVYNNVFRVSYDLSATGKHYYVNGTVVPAWQQAKRFCQDRLTKQVLALLDGILQIDGNSNCDSSKSIDELHSVDNSGSRDGGALSGFVGLLEGGGANHNIYNETISCNTSESNGSFSLVYNAIVKRYNPLLNPVENAVLHTFTKDTSYTESEGKTTTTANVKGNIQGLVRGGFIYQNNDFVLPNSGSFITLVNGAETKYSNALAYYQSQVGNQSDFLPSYKTMVGIDAASLGITNTSSALKPSSFTIDHSYTGGSVGYSATYDSNTAQSQDKGYTNISIVRNDPVEIIQEFVIPGRSSGPIIQKLGMKTARTISINIEGAAETNKECPDQNGVIEDVCNSLPVISISGFEDLLALNEGYVRTKEDYTSNRIDGSFSISLEYTCKG